MKKFRYSMENILRIKIKLEDQARLAYANARNHLIIEEEKLHILEKRRISMKRSSEVKVTIGLIL